MNKYLLGSFISAILIEVVWLLFLFLANPEPPPKCISEKALQGCEEAGFDVERQLQKCERYFQRCVDANIELQDRLKEKK